MALDTRQQSMQDWDPGKRENERGEHGSFQAKMQRWQREGAQTKHRQSESRVRDCGPACQGNQDCQGQLPVRTQEDQSTRETQGSVPLNIWQSANMCKHGKKLPTAGERTTRNEQAQQFVELLQSWEYFVLPPSQS